VALGCGLIVGGGLGNLVDRLIYGRVADFFHFHGFGYDWYVFNLADLAVTLGAVAFVYDVLKPSESSKDA
jgi:signal peptidase II